MARKRSLRYQKLLKEIKDKKFYTYEEALKKVSELSSCKFDETLEISFRLGVDPRHADQMIRGAVTMPAGLGKTVRIIVITSGENIAKAESLNVLAVGGDELINKIHGGWLDFDKIIASPEMMPKIGKIGRILGPKGLMPNPKLGTVTTDIAKAITEQQGGKAEYRTDKNGVINTLFAKASFSYEQKLANFEAIFVAIMKAKPASAKGTYLKNLSISSTMGPGLKIDAQAASLTLMK